MSMFTITRTVHVYETDLMAIVHHTNYLRYCEEARVAWCKAFVAHAESDKVFEHQNVFDLTVVETRVKHKAPIKYTDNVRIEMQAKIDGIILCFQYKVLNDTNICAIVETTHCSVNEKLKPKRLAAKYIDAVKKDTPWTETWL
ncbi:acyl-CoA thioesterase [Bdellovibrio sp. qaytius]|nr:acyl-CoA thioesterase [Bdellovibrio sp. qaytius]